MTLMVLFLEEVPRRKKIGEDRVEEWLKGGRGLCKGSSQVGGKLDGYKIGRLEEAHTSCVGFNSLFLFFLLSFPIQLFFFFRFTNLLSLRKTTASLCLNHRHDVHGRRNPKVKVWRSDL